MADEPESVADILEALHDCADSRDEVAVGDVFDTFGARSYGPFLLAPALVGLTPIGGIPGVPTFLAVTIALVAAQLAFGRRHVWLPGWIRDRAVSAEKLRKATGKLEGVARWLDRVFHGRLEALTRPPAPRIAAGVATLLCVAVPPLELLPFAVIVPMAAIAAFGLALVVRDGLLMALAFAGSAGAIGLAANALMGAGGGGG